MSKTNEPVKVSFSDAKAYCEWAGMQIPTVEQLKTALEAGAIEKGNWEEWAIDNGNAVLFHMTNMTTRKPQKGQKARFRPVKNTPPIN